MRKRFLVKPHLQLRHLFWTLSAVLVTSFTGYFIFETIVSHAMTANSLALSQWLEVDRAVRLGFGVLLVMLLAAVGIENYLLFHSFVGPLYALEQGLKRMAHGEFGREVRVRHSDQLKDLIQSFEEMRRSVQKRLILQEKAALLLTEELDRILNQTSVSNVAEIRKKLVDIKAQVEKMAA